MASFALRAAVLLAIAHAAYSIPRQSSSSRNANWNGEDNDSDCYNELGCFPQSEPWASAQRPLPAPLPPKQISTRIYSYARENPEGNNVTLWPLTSLNGFMFKQDRPTAFIIHDFSNQGLDREIQSFKDKYLEVKDANVFVVDWGKGAAYHSYAQVAANTRVVGAEVARFIKYLKLTHFLTADRIHLIGHGFGAHIAAYVGKRVPGVKHLTALDPVQPLFEGADRRVRLDKDDANYVEVVHTNGISFFHKFGLGMIRPVGHADYYINGGISQPGCLPTGHSHSSHRHGDHNLVELGNLLVSTINHTIACSHNRALQYYKEVLSHDCVIWGRRANFVSHLNGEASDYIQPLSSVFNPCDMNTCYPLSLKHVKYEARGVFLAKTSHRAPYCSPMYGPAGHDDNDSESDSGYNYGSNERTRTPYRQDYPAHIY